MKTRLNFGLVSGLIIATLLIAMGSLTPSCKGARDSGEAKTQGEVNTSAEVSQWYSEGEWLNGLELQAHESTNQKAFEALYKASPGLWNKAFDWLKTTDLETIEPGTYIIEEGNLKAIVVEAPAPELADVKWEAHKDFSDIQYIVKGKAQMGVAPLSQASITEAYDSENDIAFYEVEGAYYDAEPGTFFIFTPEDAHRPGILVPGYDTVKKVILKVRAKNPE